MYLDADFDEWSRLHDGVLRELSLSGAPVRVRVFVNGGAAPRAAPTPAPVAPAPIALPPPPGGLGDYIVLQPATLREHSSRSSAKAGAGRRLLGHLCQRLAPLAPRALLSRPAAQASCGRGWW